VNSTTSPIAPGWHRSPASAARVRRRRRAERRFRNAGLVAVMAGLAAVSLLFASIAVKGYPALWQTFVRVEVSLDPAQLGVEPGAGSAALAFANWQGVVKRALRARFPEVSTRTERRALNAIVSPGAGLMVRDRVIGNPELIGHPLVVWVPAADDVDMLVKGRVDRALPQAQRRLDDRQIRWVDALVADGDIERRFNRALFTAADSRDPELAGIAGALAGSLLALAVTLALSFPLGVGAAIYLEEFAPRNRFTDLLEVNINNLAAVPSIVFGLLGLAMFLGFAGVPRSAPLVGGLVLTLMTLPTVIIASRAALKSVPPSIRDAALAVGASPMQALLHHTVPLALPGMLTGTIIGMAQALGESAPLLMIGMVAFVADIPGSLLDPATALPVQIFMWADSAERAFEERTAAAILVLLALLVAMNLFAVLLRRRFERRW